MKLTMQKEWMQSDYMVAMRLKAGTQAKRQNELGKQITPMHVKPMGFRHDINQWVRECNITVDIFIHVYMADVNIVGNCYHTYMIFDDPAHLTMFLTRWKNTDN